MQVQAPPARRARLPVGGLGAVLVVTFVGGLVWGWAVHRDGTLIWLTLVHVLMLMGMSWFTWA
ncbi:MAG TPA: hypothetical protein VK906_00350 [Egicoccus sp.]|nr:hypothetical protein [Egicoccus sp.]HSK21590.1 hypothetical protein [Egicoccus sp.]